MTDYYTLWAHQIKTPIAAMDLILQTQRQPENSSLRHELFQIQQYVEMVLCYLRLDSDTTDFVIRTYDLDGILRAAIRKFASSFIRKQLQLRYTPVSCQVLTDEKWLLFVLEQILSNAVKYTPRGSVTIRLEEPQILVIEDTGLGIAPEDLPRIFDRGYTGQMGRHRLVSLPPDPESTGAFHFRPIHPRRRNCRPHLPAAPNPFDGVTCTACFTPAGRHKGEKHMTITLKAGASQAQIQRLNRWLQDQGGNPRICVHEGRTVLELTETTGRVDPNLLADLEFVQSVEQATERRNRYRRDTHPQDVVITLEPSGVQIGGGHFCLIAGPCSVETHEQMLRTARAVQDAGAHVLRGGAFKPRTSPYDFQGLGAAGMEILMEAKQATGLPIVTEITNVRQIPLFADVDIIQIGARNMQNFDLLKEVGKLQKPILLKRGFCATIREWLLSAEYILSEGNERVILCERGIRTFETDTRNTLDLSAVPILKHFSPLPVIVDPSHATGRAELVEPMALAATAAGADGVMIEVHHDPACALCDGAQSLTPEQFARVAKRIQNVRKALELPAQEDDEPDCRRPYFR